MYRVVFSGEIASGFDQKLVFQAATQRMKASPAQIDKVFSGRKVVLKKGMSDKEGAYYVAELKKIGMLVTLEQEPDTRAGHIPSRPKDQDTFVAPLGTESVVGNLKIHGDDDWAIASIHEPMRDVAQEDRQSGLADTDVNTQSYHQFAPGSDPVVREFRRPLQTPDRQTPPPALPSRLDFDSLARHLAETAAPTTVAATNAHAKLELNSKSVLDGCNCPHCGKPLNFSVLKEEASQPDMAAISIRPHDRLQVTQVPPTQAHTSSLTKLAAKITRILPRRSHA